MSFTFMIYTLIAVFLLMIGFSFLMRKYLKVEKRKAFSYNHVNEKHKRIDWIIRIGFLIIYTAIFFFTIRDEGESAWFLAPPTLILVYFIISEIFRAYMEWKYAENKKAYILTISELFFGLALIGIVLSMFL